MTANPNAEERFRRLYLDHARAILGYALRRTSVTDDAADAVAETFLVVLRRLDDVPDEPMTRPWLYGVARKVLANQHRGRRRRDQLAQRLRADLHDARVEDHARSVDLDVDLARLLATLPPRDREVLALSAWEGLEPREIATVLGLSPNAVRLRLSRARAALRHDPASTGHLLDDATSKEHS